MRKGNTEAAAQWQQIYDVLYTRLYSKQTAVASGLQEGLGVTSAAAAVGKALGANEDEYHRQMENAQRAQAEASGARGRREDRGKSGANVRHRRSGGRPGLRKQE